MTPVAESVIKANIVTRNVSLGMQTIGNNGWTNIESYRPTVENKKLLCVDVAHFGSTGTALSVTSDGKFLMGTPNTTVSYLQLQYTFY